MDPIASVRPTVPPPPAPVVDLSPLERLADQAEFSAAARLGLTAIRAAEGARPEDQAKAVAVTIEHASARTTDELAALGKQIIDAISLVGSGAAGRAILEVLAQRPDAAGVLVAALRMSSGLWIGLRIALSYW